VTSFFEIKGTFLHFSRKTTSCAKVFFRIFRRKHLFITICIEKQCTWPLTDRFTDRKVSKYRLSCLYGIDLLNTFLRAMVTYRFTASPWRLWR